MLGVQHLPDLYTLSTFPVLAIVLPLLSLIILGRWKPPPRFPPSIPRPSIGNNRFAKLRASYRGWPTSLPNLSEGYRKFNIQGQPYIHATPSLRPQVILPVKDFEWLLHLPDSMLSVQEAMNDSAGIAHLLTGRDATLEKIATLTVSQHLTQSLGLVQPDLLDELQLSLDRVLGLDTDEWNSVCIFSAMEQVVTQIAGRLLFGKMLCRDYEGYIPAVLWCMHCFGAGMILTAQLLPWFLQPIVSVFFRIPLKFAIWRLSLYTKPLTTRWLKQIVEEESQTNTESTKVPYNMATTFIRIAQKQNRSGQYKIDAYKITSCLNQIAMLPFGTTIPSSSALLLDIAHQKGLSQSLQQEAATALTSNEAWTDLCSFNKLSLAESTIKETLRLNPIQLHASNREVIHPNGLTLPTGQHLPCGTWAAASAWDVHLDERFYPDPMKYDPCRFLDSESQKTLNETQNINRLAASSRFLPFGAGRHAW
ncbi:cytochrome P450 [Aspergillus karnatakaensis]|uniref:cytochrome P450 n=1 Tax=Aspergillus karnatakaensis TaxID=1810916 RepID=UPI003CCE4E9B